MLVTHNSSVAWKRGPSCQQQSGSHGVIVITPLVQAGMFADQEP
jgi:hypothetical protein